MSKFTITKAIFIIVAGLVGSYFIIKSDFGIKSGNEKSKKENIPDNFTNLIGDNPIQWVKDNSQKTSKTNAENSSDKIASQISENKNQPINFTEFVAKSMFTQMKNFDQKGINPSNGLDLKNQEGQELIKQTLAEISDPSLLIKDYQINDKDLKISKDNSSVKKVAYIEAIATIIYNNSNSLYKNPINVLEKLILGDVSNANKLADTYQNIFNGFLNTEVPSDWLSLHKKYMTLLKKFENLYRGLTVFKQDPIKANLLIQMIPDMANAEFKIQQEYSEKEKILGI